MNNSDIHLAIVINAVLHVMPLALLPFIAFKHVTDKHITEGDDDSFSWREAFVGARMISELNMISVLVLNTVNYLVIINVMELFMPVSCQTSSSQDANVMLQITLNVTTASVHGKYCH